ncbi:MAG: phospho-N-acetylmuramoyl-pentapeptide-transferase [Planctomycetota bacterium]|nr:phospho-N-acetylmuramoyl-pentapeptide-transferase [Planctomycetaceae bacterium]MDQ3329331.1 phospho-N-acetylmuramoyl-pentapeptide-transferase [Planctomycetota bacterium]
MLVWILDALAADAVSSITSTDRGTSVVLIGRSAVAMLCALFATLCLGPIAIRFLRQRFRERIDSASESLNSLHSGKASTPTMGGALLIAVVVGSTVAFCDLTKPAVWVALVAVVAFGSIGAVDDWIKATTRRRGLTVGQKVIAQIVAATYCGMLLHSVIPSGDLKFDIPFTEPLLIAGAMLPVWASFVLVAGSNAVNLTDGLDGLAGGCGVIASSVMTLVCGFAAHPVLALWAGMPYTAPAGELAIVLSSLTGALIGFLKFNRYPAKVFMGDTGSLPIGALLGVAGLVARQELLLVIACGVYAVEALSVMAQVGWFKATGTRLIRCSPLHNHFVLAGHHEPRIVQRFWMAGVGCAFLAIASLWAN